MPWTKAHQRLWDALEAVDPVTAAGEAALAAREREAARQDRRHRVRARLAERVADVQAAARQSRVREKILAEIRAEGRGNPGLAALLDMSGGTR